MTWPNTNMQQSQETRFREEPVPRQEVISCGFKLIGIMGMTGRKQRICLLADRASW